METELLDSALCAGWTFRSFTGANSVSLPYQIYIPQNYDRSRKYPVLLFMHGMGSVGCDGEHIRQKVAEYLRIVTEGKYKDEVLIIAPQCPRGHRWVNINRVPTDGIYKLENMPMTDHLAAAVELFEYVCESFSIDPNRIYGYGNSMGAFAIIYLALTYPETFAAIVSVAGGGDPDKAHLLKNVPTWIFHGDADKTVDIKGSRSIARNARAVNAKDVRLTVFEGVGHHAIDCFVAAANTEGLLEWMFSQKKGS